jgi:hypothetical protein
MGASLVLSGLLVSVAVGQTPAGLGREGKPAAMREYRLQAAAKAYEAALAALKNGKCDPEAVYRWSRRVLEAQRGMAGQAAQLEIAARGHLKRMRELAKFISSRYRDGKLPQLDALASDYYVVEAALLLQETRAQAK